MILDHILGRPSPTIQRINVILNLLLARYLASKRPPSFLGFLSSVQWKTIIATLSVKYAISNSLLLLYFNAPEPHAKLYTRNFYRATWLMTALDAGFFSVMHVKPKFLRDILGIALSLFYLVYADCAEEKVRRFRALASYQMMRCSWEKSTDNSILRFITYFDRGYLAIRKNITFKRPSNPPSPTSFPDILLPDIKARLYYNGKFSQMVNSTSLIFFVPGGGFVSMSPENHGIFNLILDDYLSAWARKTNVPVIAINYGKAPQHPYPYALEEVYDAYRSIVESNGECIGIKSTRPLKIIIGGDSAGFLD